MKIKILPINGGFINRTLFFNLSNSLFDKQDMFLNRDVSLAFIVEGGIVFGVDLFSYKFWVYDPNTDDEYGPYNSYQEAICTHIFGKIDGLFHTMSNIKLNEAINAYEFSFEGFIYNPFTYNFTAPIKQTAALLHKQLRVVKEPFQFTFVPETDFGDNVITNFIIRLDKIFQPNNFDTYFKDTKLNTIIRTDRMEVSGYRVDEHPFICINMNMQRHMVVYLPKLMYKGYFNIVNMLDSDDVFKKVFTDDTVKVTNLKDVLEAKKIFNIDIEDVEVELQVVNIVPYLETVISTDRNDEIVYVLNIDNKKYTITANFVSKTFVFDEFKSMKTCDYNVENNNGIVVSKESGVDAKHDILIETNNNTFDIDYSTEMCNLKDNYSIDIEYLSNIEL
jgi:hypothetical protein